MSKRTCVLLFCLASCVGLSGIASAANWPRFRGPNGEGVAADKDIPVKFDDKTSVIWKLPLPGTGNSSPIIWNDRLFIQSGTPSERMLLCIDVKEGKVLWTRTVPGGQVKVHNMNTLASASPATDGETVVAAFWDGSIHLLKAYDFAGNPRWEKKLGPFKSEHGHGASPIIYGGKVYFANDQDGSAVLQVFDVKTGQPAWEARRTPFRANYAAPFVLELPNTKPQLICVNSMDATSYDPGTGTPNWKWDWVTPKKPLRAIGAPVICNGMLVVFSGDGNGDRHTVGVKLDGVKPKTAWEQKKDMPYVPCPIVNGDYIYFVHDKGFAGCIEAKTGKKVWYERLAGAKDMTASPILVDGKVYAASEQGDVFVFAATPKYELLAQTTSMK